MRSIKYVQIASFKFNDFFLGILLFNVQGPDSRSLMYSLASRLIRTKWPSQIAKITHFQEEQFDVNLIWIFYGFLLFEDG